VTVTTTAQTARPTTPCTNDAAGFTIRYPAGWHTDTVGPGGECLFFDPEPFAVPANSDFTGTALEVHVPQEPFDAVVRSLTDERFARVLEREAATVAGRPALRLLVEATGEGLLDAGTRVYEYVVDRGDTPPLVVQTTLTAAGDLDRRRAVVDEAVRTLELSAPERDDAAGLPAGVAATRDAVLAAANARDWDALAALIDEARFRYSFGGPVEGGAVAYWQKLERTTAERPLDALAAILRMPYVLSRGIYVWPFAYAAPPGELTAYERELLAPIADAETIRGWAEAGGYYGWRAGIEPDGTWVFYVAGD
jgi:hypothetical protein